MKLKLLALILAIMLLFTGCLGDDKGTDKPSSNGTPPSGDTSNGTVAEEGHADADDDGKCDDCGISVIINFDFYAINDMHGKFADSDSMIGVDELTTFIKNSQSRDKNAVFLSSGDMWQGSSESNLTKGLIVTEWMSALDFVSMTLGNHEFDWGEEYIKSNLAVADFPFLAINIYERDTNELVDYVKPSVVVEKSGLQIGIIGAIGNCYSSISGEKVEDIYFKTGAELTALVKAEAERLRSEEGADLIVYSVHDGRSRSSGGIQNVSGADISDYYDTSLSNGYVDVVFEGHTHCNYVLLDEHGVYHVQNGGDNDGISHVDVDINFANGNTKVNTAEVIKSSRYSSLLDDPLVSDLLAKYDDQISISNKVLGTNVRERGRDELRQLNARLYYEAGVKKWGSQYDIVLGGGYTSVRSPGYLDAGEVKYSHVQSLFPFDNTIQLCSIKGRDLISRFFENPHADYFIYFDSYGQNVWDNVDPNATYYIITDTYNSSYADNKLTVVADYAPDVYARDLIAEYIEKGGFSANPPQPETPDNPGGNNPGGDTPDTPGGNTPSTPTEPKEKYLTVSEILSMFNSFAKGEESANEYLVLAKIKSITHTTYGNMIITDDSGNELLVYGTYNFDGSLMYKDMDKKPEAGDLVVLSSVVKRYTNAEKGEDYMELYHANIIDFATPISISKALEIANSLDGGAETLKSYAIEGTVKDIASTTWGNMTVKDASGEIYVYGAYDVISGDRYDAMGDKPVANDTVLLFGPLKKYVKDSNVTLEFVSAKIVKFS